MLSSVSTSVMNQKGASMEGGKLKNSAISEASVDCEEEERISEEDSEEGAEEITRTSALSYSLGRVPL